MLDFQLIYPDVFAYRLAGGVLESSSQASGTGNAAGVAGPVPIPLLVQAGEVFPTHDPVTGQEVPQDIRRGYQSIDFQSMPNQCRSEYPDIYGQGLSERYCGGPAQRDPAVGFTAALVNGHTFSSGDTDNPLSTRSESTSRGVDVFVPSLQLTVRQAWAQATSGLNSEGLPQARSIVDMDQVSILNGLIRISHLRSEAVAVSDGTESGTRSTTSFRVGDASVAGIPVVIGRDGIRVRDDAVVPGQSIQNVAEQVSQALQAADVNVRLLPPATASKLGSQTAVWTAGIEIVHRGEAVRRSDSFYRLGYVSAAVGATGDSGQPVEGVESSTSTGEADSETSDPASEPSADNPSDAELAGDIPPSLSDPQPSPGATAAGPPVDGSAVDPPVSRSPSQAGSSPTAASRASVVRRFPVELLMLPDGRLALAAGVLAALAALGTGAVPLRRIL
jgi:hypothetical protein